MTKHLKSWLLLFSFALSVLAGCSKSHNVEAEAPPPAKVITAADESLFSVDHPEQFPLAAAVTRASAPELVVTGVVNPDVARNVPVISLAGGRVVGIYARLGDTVKKGQLLLLVRSDDVSGGFSDYRKAVADEVLVRGQLSAPRIFTNTAPWPRPIMRSHRTRKTRQRSTWRPRKNIFACSATIHTS